MPSGASSARRDVKRLASLTFFLDRQIGRYVVAEALRAAKARVKVHDDHFGQATPDLQWIPEIGRRDWVLITKDQNIRRNPIERAAYQAAGVRGFIVTGKDMSGKELATLLVACLPRMVRKVSGRSGPLLYTISRTGTFTDLSE